MMVRLVEHPDVSLRFYGSQYGTQYGVVARRDGARRAVCGELLELLRRVEEGLGMEALCALGRGAAPPDPALAPAADALRRLFALLDETPPTPCAALLGQQPGFAEHLAALRVPVLSLCELTHRCNLACRHCYILHRVRAPRPAMASEADLLAAVASVARLGGLDISLSGGEPTFHPAWRRVLRRAKDLHLYTIFKTNGSSFTARNAAAYAADPAHETHLSIYGAGAATHDAFTTVPGSFEKTLAGLRQLGRHGVRCRLLCLVWRDNARQLGEIASLVESMGHEVSFSDLIYGRLDGDSAPLLSRIDADERQRLVEEGFLEPFTPAPCIAGQMKLRLDAAGEMAICELLPRSFGNVRERPLEAIWNDPQTRAYSARILALSTAGRDSNGAPVRSCPGLDRLEKGGFGEQGSTFEERGRSEQRSLS